MVKATRTDPDVRSVLIPALRESHPGALLVQEWGVVGNYASTSAGTLIVDVATVGEASIEAWEIKSAADSLGRLVRQVPLYSALFPRCTLVTTRSHLVHVDKLIPEWWGVTLVEDGQLVEKRPAQANPDARPAELLWSMELAPLVRRLGLHTRGTRPGKGFMLERLAAYPDQGQLLAEVCATIRARQDWRDATGISANRDARREARRQRQEDEARRREAAAAARRYCEDLLAAAARPAPAAAPAPPAHPSGQAKPASRDIFPSGAPSPLARPLDSGAASPVDPSFVPFATPAGALPSPGHLPLESPPSESP